MQLKKKKYYWTFIYVYLNIVSNNPLAVEKSKQKKNYRLFLFKNV